MPLRLPTRAASLVLTRIPAAQFPLSLRLAGLLGCAWPPSQLDGNQAQVTLSGQPQPQCPVPHHHPPSAQVKHAKPLLPPLLHPFNQTWPRPETPWTAAGHPFSTVPGPAGAPDCSAARRLLSSFPTVSLILLLPDTAHDPASSTPLRVKPHRCWGWEGTADRAPRPPAIPGPACQHRRGVWPPLDKWSHSAAHSTSHCPSLSVSISSLSQSPSHPTLRCPEIPTGLRLSPGAATCFLPRTSLMPSRRRCYDSGASALS